MSDANGSAPEDPKRHYLTRYARVCPTRAKTNCIWRAFGDPEAVCPIHGRGIDQPPHKPRRKHARSEEADA